jgi:hypothetical protein
MRASISNVNPSFFGDGFKLFLAGHSYDQNCAHRDLCRDVVTVISTIAPLEFLYTSPFDQQGVLAWLRTVGSRLLIDQKNVICCGNIEFEKKDLVRHSEIEGWSKICKNDKPKRLLELLGQQSLDGYLFNPNKEKDNSHFIIDLQRFRLRITSMTLSDNSSDEYEFNEKTFDFLGSHDGNSWNQIGVESYLGVNEKEGTFKLKSVDCYRFFKIENTGDFTGFPITLSGVEVYGNLI